MPVISSSPESPESTLLSDEARQREIDRRRGRFVPWIIAAFYLTFTSVLVAFVVIAYQHPPSDVTTEAYEKGLAYDDTLAKSRAASTLGWQTDLTFAKGQVTLVLRDSAGAPLKDAKARAWLVRPIDGTLDFTTDLKGSGEGAYTAAVTWPAPGLWEIHATALRDGKQVQAVATVQVP